MQNKPNHNCLNQEYCVVCSPKPNKAIFVDDVKNPVCPHCGQKLLTNQKDNMSRDYLVRIGVKSKKDTKVCVTNLDEWLAKKNIKFESVDFVDFKKEVMLATVEFDKDNMIYVILPKEVFEESLTPRKEA